MDQNTLNYPPIIAPPKVLEAVLLCLIILVALAVRLIGINKHSLWYDELASVSCSAGRGLWHETIPPGRVLSPPPRPTHIGGTLPEPAIWRSLQREQHPPVYFMTLRAWRWFAGSSDFSLRLLTIAFAIAALVATWEAARVWFGPSAGLWAAFLLALSSPFISLSLQVRGYVPMAAYVAIAAGAIAKIDTRGLSALRITVLGLALLAAMLTHYFALPACIAFAAFAAIALRGRVRLAVLGASAAAAVLYLATWGPFLLEQRSNFSLNRGYLAEQSATPFLTSFTRAATAPLRLFWAVKPSSQLIAIPFFLVVILPLVLAWRHRALLIIGLWIFVPIAMILSLDLARHTQQLELVRYFIVAAPAACIALPALACTLTSRWAIRHLIPAAMALSLLLVLITGEPYSVEQSEPADYRVLAQAFSDHGEPASLVVFTGGGRGDWYANWLYLAMSHYAKLWPDAAVVLYAKPDASLNAELSQHDIVLLVAGPGAVTNGWFPEYEERLLRVDPYAGSVSMLKRPLRGAQP